MHLPLLHRLGLLAIATLGSAPRPSETASVGDVPAHEFRTAPLNGLGATSLADLRGKPVLVEFWGTR